MAGILYWFWSHIQLTQKKVLLLESAVFELRSQFTRIPDTSIHKPTYSDLADDWEEEAAADMSGTPVDVPDDLRPGGHMSIEETELSESSRAEKTVEESNTQFRELFLHDNTSIQDTKPATPSPTITIEKIPESLESMSLKELRRLAEQRGIPNSNDLRKKEILSALRHQITAPAPVPVPVPEEEEKVVQLVEVPENEISE